VRRPVFALVALLLLAAAPGRGLARGEAQGQAQEGAALQPPASATATAISGVVAAGTRIELVKFPVQGTEGPVGLPDGSGIIFTETRADHITRVDASGTTSTFVEKSNGSNGLGWDPKGRLISVQRAPGNEKVGVLYPAGSEATLVDNFEGKPFNRLNDLVVSTRGGIYFTDTQGVYYLPPGAPGSAVKKVIQGIRNPNGVMLSPDEKTAYANDKDGLYLLAFDVQADGTLANRRNFGKYKSLTVPGHTDPLLAEDNGADGLAVDTDGRVYVATNLGVEVFSPRGDHLGVIPIGIWGGEQNMLRKPQNLTFSGPDRKTLYTVGANAVYRVRLLAQGLKTRGK
jgi:gluconolactonase